MRFVCVPSPLYIIKRGVRKQPNLGGFMESYEEVLRRVARGDARLTSPPHGLLPVRAHPVEDEGIVAVTYGSRALILFYQTGEIKLHTTLGWARATLSNSLIDLLPRRMPSLFTRSIIWVFNQHLPRGIRLTPNYYGIPTYARSIPRGVVRVVLQDMGEQRQFTEGITILREELS